MIIKKFKNKVVLKKKNNYLQNSYKKFLQKFPVLIFLKSYFGIFKKVCLFLYSFQNKSLEFLDFKNLF